LQLLEAGDVPRDQHQKAGGPAFHGPHAELDGDAPSVRPVPDGIHQRFQHGCRSRPLVGGQRDVAFGGRRLGPQLEKGGERFALHRGRIVQSEQRQRLPVDEPDQSLVQDKNRVGQLGDDGPEIGIPGGGVVGTAPAAAKLRREQDNRHQRRREQDGEDHHSAGGFQSGHKLGVTAGHCPHYSTAPGKSRRSRPAPGGRSKRCWANRSRIGARFVYTGARIGGDPCQWPSVCT